VYHYFRKYPEDSLLLKSTVCIRRVNCCPKTETLTVL
jgi:hypothetical protein